MLKRKPLAIMPAYNEADIIHQTTRHLIDQDFDVHVIDNRSTDLTVPRIDTRCSVSSFPPPGDLLMASTVATKWADILCEVERIASLAEHIGRWVMFNDADEIRYGPSHQPLAEWFWAAQRRGYSAVQFEVRNYVPTSDGWIGRQDPEDFFTHYERSVLDSRLPHIKAWYSSGQRVDLHSSGGHIADFHWMSVDPTPGILKHYPIRSQSHGERKVFRERNLRWSQAEKRAGWHQQYEHMQPGYSFIRSPDDPALVYDDSHEAKEARTNGLYDERIDRGPAGTQSAGQGKEVKEV